MAPLTLLLFVFVFVSLPSPTLSEPLGILCEGSNYTSNSTFESNLNHLLTSLSLASANFTFNKSTQGSSPYVVYGLFLCRGDVGPSVCHDCVQTATQNATLVCPDRNELTLWYDDCQLRYSDTTFFGGSGNPNFVLYPLGPNTTADPNTFSKFTEDLIQTISYTAAYNSSELKFATGELSYGDGEKEVTIFGMAECTRDVSKDACSSCFKDIIHEGYSDCCGARKYGGILAKSCNFRYDVNKFFDGEPTVLIKRPYSSSSPPAPAPSLVIPSPPPASVPTGHKTVIIISIVISLVVVSALTTATYFFYRKKSTHNTQSMARPDEISTPESLYYDLSVLKVATSNFSDANKLGEGGFGKVYKGILPNGEIIAVKRLSASSRQGIGELKNELLLVAKLQHRNLVRLQGVCLEGGERLLVYECMPNGSLDKFLFDRAKRRQLNWGMRFKIIGGIARGLVYLHEEAHLKVIHRDLKASNVLLDANMKPKISDFGLARLFHDDTQGITNQVVGTFGYMAPEYARRGRFSTKLDVYSYGILVLEIVTGKKNSNFKYDSQECQDLLSYAWKHWRKGTTLAIFDPTLGDNCPRNEVFRCIQIGLLCAQEVPADRPSMSTVFFMLNSPSMPLQIPIQPTFLDGLNMDSDVFSNSKQSYSVSPSLAVTNLEEISTIDSLMFKLSVLKVATNNFAEANKLGQGGFASVYKGILSDGQEIAVKRLAVGSTQGVDDLKNELFLVAKLQHRNLVRLHGVCLEEEEMLLVYEYVPNRSLDNFLFDPIKCKQLNWTRRFNIIGGIARGLFYLHEESHLKVVHRDLKASNILLDTDMNSKISDFGLARLFGGDETQGMTSRVVGTFGYMAPEYALHGQFSTKVDVYSYGVLALEIVTGRKNRSFLNSEHNQDILGYVWKHWTNGTILDIMDPSLDETISRSEVMRCIHIALLCVQEIPAQRPPMSSVVLMLYSPSVPLQAPLQPRFFTKVSLLDSDVSGKQKDVDSGDGSTSQTLPISVNEVSITDLYPR